MANCNKCGGDRNAYVRATHAVPGSDGEVSWETVMEILGVWRMQRDQRPAPVLVLRVGERV